MSSSSAPPPPSQPSKPQRILACVRCQQRKIRCDRRFPCANCNTSRVQCVPATVTPRGQRKRRFPERELLDRLRKYEELLRQNNIGFEPLHRHTGGEKTPSNTLGGNDSDEEQPSVGAQDSPSPTATVKSERIYEAKNFLHSLNSGFRDHHDDSDSSQDEVRDVVVTKGWDQMFGDNDYLLFGSPNTDVDLSTLHPEPVQIFRLWQIYLDNVNSLVKVTHTPSLQGKIIEAAGNVTSINPTLEALLFSIYCAAIHSLTAEDCQATFGSSRKDLLTRFQFGCQQALLNCGFLKSSDRDCLTALYLFLVSLGSVVVPRSLSSMLGIAIRIAQRMGIDSEPALARCDALEAELRRRLWWSLVIFDTRIGQLAEYKSTVLTPTWDCRIPFDISDFDLRPEMKEPPTVLGKFTESLFAVVRGEIADFIRNTMFYLDFTAPALKPIARDVHNGPIPETGEVTILEKMMEDKYLKHCDPGIPLHFMTIWTVRSFMARYHLLEHHAKYSGSSGYQADTDIQRDTAVSYAITMLECDTKLMTSPLTKGFRWIVQIYFPFPAFIHLLQDLRKRPASSQAEQAWAAMNDNYEIRFDFLYKNDNPFFNMFSRIVFQAWEARELAFGKSGAPVTPPKLVLSIKELQVQKAQRLENDSTTQPHEVVGTSINDYLLSMPMEFRSPTNGMEGQASFSEMGSEVFSHIPGQPTLNVNMNDLDWSVMNWSMNEPAAQAELYSRITGQVPFGANGLDPSTGLGFGQWASNR